ncbi:MAG: translation initiation factor IF-3 [Planctomycetia bacterium]|nr:translation initiation factor IF-3 [Planctomycetia bacterium]
MDDGGEQLGIIPTAEALAKARDLGLDLVEVAPEATPPVCRIMDFGKFKYRIQKRGERTKAHQSKLKEIRVRPRTDEHDIAVKVNKARGFLQDKDKVLVSVVFRGRELAHIEEGVRVINHIVELLQDVGKPDAPPKHAAKRIECRFSPK